MPDRNELQREIDMLLETIQQDYADLDKLDPMSPEHAAMRRRLEWLSKELTELIARRDRAEPAS
jgi:hypothetical protein